MTAPNIVLQRVSSYGGFAMTAPNIVLLGKAGAGKSTCADVLVSDFSLYYGMHYRRYAIAEPLKDIAAQLWGDGAEGDRGKLQALGVALRDIDEDVWIRKCCARIELETTRPYYLGGLYYLGGSAVVDDCRFPNELQMLREMGFVSVRVVAERNRRLARLQANGKIQDEAQLEHSSETALDDYPADHTLINNASMGDLRYALADILNRYQF